MKQLFPQNISPVKVTSPCHRMEKAAAVWWLQHGRKAWLTAWLRGATARQATLSATDIELI